MQQYTKSLVKSAGCCGLLFVSILSVIKTNILVGYDSFNTRPPLSTADDDLAIKTCRPYANELNFSETILVLVTSTSPLHERTNFTKNVILNWSMLRPWIQPVIFVDNISSHVAMISRQNGWLVRPVPRTRSTLPVFKDLIFEASTINPRVPFIGFANDDILFGYDIINTMVVLNESLDSVREKFVFVTGRRRNVDGELLVQIPNVYCPRSVYLLAKDIVPFTPDSADYFIFAAGAVVQYWGDMPEFVIGRSGYDNWLISSAVTRNATAIEATGTITALHQTGEDGIRSGHFRPGSRNRTDKRLNRDLIPEFDYSAGLQYCIQWITERICNERLFPFKILKKDCIRLSKRAAIKQSCIQHLHTNVKFHKKIIDITSSNITDDITNNITDAFTAGDYSRAGGHQRRQEHK